MLEAQKHLFDLPEEVTYLNIAAQSPSFKSVTKAGIEGLTQKSLPYTITGDDYFEPVKQLKQRFAALIGASEWQRVANIPSVSYGIATIAKNITLKKGDEILLIEGQFPSNYYSWKRLADKHEASIITIGSPEASENRVEQWNQKILEAITDNTAVVAMGNIHWSNGALFHLKAIRKKTKQHNALLIIDGSQTIGAFPFSVTEIDPDAIVCAGYKWLFGPYGCAYAYYGSYFDNGTPIEENWINRLDSTNFARLTNYQEAYEPLANRYCAGQGASFIYIKMQIAALKQVLQWEANEVQEYCKAISKETVLKLQEKGCEIDNPNSRTHHLFGVKIPETADLNGIKTAFKQNDIFVSYRGNYIRLSCHLFNTEADFDKLYNHLSPHL